GSPWNPPLATRTGAAAPSPTARAYPPNQPTRSGAASNQPKNKGSASARVSGGQLSGTEAPNSRANSPRSPISARARATVAGISFRRAVSITARCLPLLPPNDTAQQRRGTGEL